MVLDIEQAEADLAAGVLACPRCAGPLRPWSSARARRIRQLDGGVLGVLGVLGVPGVPHAAAHTCFFRPGACPGGPTPSRSSVSPWSPTPQDMAIAASPWLSADRSAPWAGGCGAVRGEHGRWLYRHGVEHASRLAPEVLGEVAAQPTELGDALTALGTAVLAFRRRFARRVPSWTLVGIFTCGQLFSRHHRMINKPPAEDTYVLGLAAPWSTCEIRRAGP